jgi:type I restriction enzyme S subunit
MRLTKRALGEVLELRYGKSLPETKRIKGSYPVYGSGGKVGSHKEALVEGPGIIVGRKGSIGAVYWEKNSFFPIDTVYYVRNFENELDLKFAYYLLKHLPLNKLNSDAAVPGLNREIALSYEAVIPPPPIQRKIASILSVYDDLIENNLKRIALLEKSAKLLYEEWFVHLRFPGHEHIKITGGVPEGWEKTYVPEIIDINPKTKVPKDGENWHVDMAALATDSMVINDPILKEGNSGSKFKNGDTLFARITPCLENGKTGYVNFLEEGKTACGSTEFIVLRGKHVPSEFVYCLSRTYDFRENAIKNMVGSSGRQRVKVTCFDEFPTPLPPKTILGSFKDNVAPCFKQIKTLSTQNQKLKQARDILLPKLINGEIAV